MRIGINLASEPFRRDRPFTVAAWVLGLILTGLLGTLIYSITASKDVALEARQAVERAQGDVQKLTSEQARLEGVLRQPVNGAVIERSVFLNQLLQRKAISWTRIFSDLEKVVPHNVRLVSVRPQITPDNQVLLDMVVGCQAPEPVIEMLMRLESAPQFGANLITSYLPPSQQEPLNRYRVVVNYTQKL